MQSGYPSFMFSHDWQLSTFYWSLEDQNSIGSFDLIRFQDSDGSVMHHLLLTHSSLTEGSPNSLTKISNYYDTVAAQVYSGGCLQVWDQGKNLAYFEAYILNE